MSKTFITDTVSVSEDGRLTDYLDDFTLLDTLSTGRYNIAEEDYVHYNDAKVKQ